MSNTSFECGAVYVRDYILAFLLGMQNAIGHTDPDNPKYEAYQQIYDSIADRFGDLFTDFKY